MRKQVCMSQVFQMGAAAAGSVLKNRNAPPNLLICYCPRLGMSAVRFIDLGLWDNKFPL